MPRYFFHTADGALSPDKDGTELPDLDAARMEAVKLAGEVISKQPDLVTGTGEFRVEVADAAGKHLFTIVTQALEGARDGEQRPARLGE